MIEFTTATRKKAFENIFKKKILPFFIDHDFIRHTKTSKRLFKKLDKELSVFIFLEYLSRFESYGITVVYFDDELGNVYDDNYLAMANIKTRGFSGDNIEKLNLSADEWLIELQSTLIPFIEKNASYKAILESNDFYISPASKDKCLELLKRKSKA